MALTVLVLSGEGADVPSLSFETPRIVLGRGDSCDVRLPDPSVSHRHASIHQRGSDYIVMDEGSTNGTFAGPVRLSPKAPRVLRSGEKLRLGRVWLQVKVESVPASPKSQVLTHEMALKLVAQALKAQGDPFALVLKVLSGPDEGHSSELTEFDTPYVLGRSPRAVLKLTDPDASRRHVQLVRRGGQLLARDLGSKTGSRIDDIRLQTENDTPWIRGSVLYVGQNQFCYEDPAADMLAEIEQGGDERIPPDEPVDQPFDESTVEPQPPAETSKSSTSAPAARNPPKSSARKSGRDESTWSSLDFAVALISLVVLAVSILGLVWLLQAN